MMAQPDRDILNGLSEEERKEAEKVRRWRHNIQRELLPTDEYLQRRGPLTTDIARPAEAWFQEIEGYERMTIQSLNYSKIGKVMRHIALLDADALPHTVDDVFKFRERARKLVDRWHSELIGGPRHRYKPSVDAARTSTPSRATEEQRLSTEFSVQTSTFLVGAPPAKSPLADVPQSEESGSGVEERGDTNSEPAEHILDIAPPARDAAFEHPIVSAIESSLSADEPADGVDAVGVHPDVSPGTATPPSLAAEVDPVVQGETDEGTQNDSVDDWVVIDVNVQMASVRIS